MTKPARQVILVDVDDTCIPDKIESRAAIGYLLDDVTGASGEVAIDSVLDTARALWRAGPFHHYCLRVGISSWEGLWLRPFTTPLRTEFPDWVQKYQRSVWEATFPAL